MLYIFRRARALIKVPVNFLDRYLFLTHVHSSPVHASWQDIDSDDDY